MQFVEFCSDLRKTRIKLVRVESFLYWGTDSVLDRKVETALWLFLQRRIVGSFGNNAEGGNKTLNELVSYSPPHSLALKKIELLTNYRKLPQLYIGIRYLSIL